MIERKFLEQRFATCGQRPSDCLVVCKQALTFCLILREKYANKAGLTILTTRPTDDNDAREMQQ